MLNSRTSRTLATLLLLPCWGAAWPQSDVHLSHRINGPYPQVRYRAVNWVPAKTSLPGPYVSAAQRLLGNGLSDPRGLPFAKVRLTDQNQDTLGWASRDGKSAILLDGLIYPITAVLRPARLKEIFEGGEHLQPAGAYVENQLPSAAPALLLVLGEVALAERAYSAKVFDPQLYSALHRRLRLRIVEDLEKRRDKQGLERAKRLLLVKQLARAFDEPLERDQLPTPDDLVLLQDLARRVSHPRPAWQEGKLQGLSAEERLKIAAEYLDDYQGSLPYWYSVDVPVVREFTRFGFDSVPILLNVMEHDNRLTRSSILDSRTWISESLHPVKDVALAVIQANWPSLVALNRNQTDADALRTTWRATRHLSEPERWILVFRNPKTDVWTLMQGLDYLNQATYNNGTFSKGIYPPPTRRSSNLTRTQCKEVTSLIEGRIRSTFIASKETMNWSHQQEWLCMIAHGLYKFDPQGSLPSLRLVSSRGLAVAFTNPRSQSYALAQVISDRVALDDESAIGDYALILGTYYWNSDLSPSQLTPLTQGSREVKMSRLANEFLSLPQVLLATSNRDQVREAIMGVSHCLRSPLLGFRVFRQTVARCLDSDVIFGVAQQNVDPSREDYSLVSNDVPPLESLKYHQFFLTCGDYLARELANLRGAPKMPLKGSEEDRRVARLRLREWILDDSIDWGKASGF